MIQYSDKSREIFKIFTEELQEINANQYIINSSIHLNKIKWTTKTEIRVMVVEIDSLSD